MNVTYARISTIEQNAERQIIKGQKSFIDSCSGSISFFERPQAKKLIAFLKSNPGTTVNICAVDRLGRNTIDILQTLEYFKANDFNLKVDNIGMDSSSPFFNMLVSILGTLAEQERKTIAERCAEGIAIAKSKGLYQGRKTGTVDSRQKTLSKHNDIVMCLSKGMKISDIATVTNKTRMTIYKVKELM